MAGLTDGEGCIAINIFDEITFLSFRPTIQIAGRTTKMFQIREFLEKEGIKSHVSIEHGIIMAVTINSWESIKIFCEKIGDLVLKKEELELMRKAISFYFSLEKIGTGRRILPYQKEFLEMAISLQEFKSNKDSKKKNYIQYRNRFP